MLVAWDTAPARMLVCAPRLDPGLLYVPIRLLICGCGRLWRFFGVIAVCRDIVAFVEKKIRRGLVVFG